MTAKKSSSKAWDLITPEKERPSNDGFGKTDYKKKDQTLSGYYDKFLPKKKLAGEPDTSENDTGRGGSVEREHYMVKFAKDRDAETEAVRELER